MRASIARCPRPDTGEVIYASLSRDAYLCNSVANKNRFGAFALIPKFIRIQNPQDPREWWVFKIPKSWNWKYSDDSGDGDTSDDFAFLDYNFDHTEAIYGKDACLDAVKPPLAERF